jgi:cell division protein FtsL
MKKLVYGTILIFVIIMVTVAVIAVQHPPRLVKYENGQIVETDRAE